MSTDAPGASPAPHRLAELVAAEQLRLIGQQVLRMPLVHFALDAVIAWTGARAGVGAATWVWLVSITLAKAGRAAYLRRLLDAPGPPERRLAVHANVLGLVACLQAAQMVLVFAQPPSDAQYILTMVMVGTAAGAVGTSAGHLRTFVTWAAVFMGSLAVCWLTHRDVQGGAIAVLLLMMGLLFALYVRDQGRTLLHLVTLTEDLREQRDKLARMSAELRQERDRAERASEAKTRFFASASHDLRQPLTALSYNAATVQTLARSGGDELLAQVGQSIGRALSESRDLLDRLLEVSQLDAGAVEVQLADVDLVALLAEVREGYAAAAAERGIALLLAVPPVTALTARTDTVVLRRIVQNLVSNAIKFTTLGSVTLAAGRAAAPGQVEVRVIDTGPGIAPEQQEQVFEEFFQIGNLERDRRRGLGLGLAIVRRLAALVGAHVELHSVPGRGSTFVVRLPGGAAAAPGGDDAVRTIAPSPALRETRRILVVDDESEVREALATLLGALGWEVAAEPGPDEALARVARGFAADALIVDFRLRDGATGFETLDALRRAGCNAPAWLITGDTDPRRIAQARASGMPVIYKPVDGLALAAMLREAFEGAPAAQSG